MSNPWPSYVVVVLLGGLLAGCSADAAARRQFTDFRAEIDRMQADNGRLNERVTSLERDAANRSANKKAKTNKKPAKEGGKPPRLKVVRLEPGDDGLGDPDAAKTEGKARTVISVQGDSAPSVRRETTDPSAADRNESATRQYNKALELVRQNEYDQAVEGFSVFLARFPRHRNADNAMYWRGECYYAKGDYVRAAQEFEGMVARFPKGNKVPDALLKLGKSHLQMRERAKARKVFARLRKAYGSSDAASKIPTE